MQKPIRLLKKLPDMASSRPDAEIFFFDEGRFGLKPVMGRCWTRRGGRAVQPGYKNFYMYSAANSATGEDVILFLPWVNTAMMNIFLENLGVALGGGHCLLAMDQAKWHTTDELQVPSTIELVFLPHILRNSTLWNGYGSGSSATVCASGFTRALKTSLRQFKVACSRLPIFFGKALQMQLFIAL
jgi:hypothetical protein